MANVGQQALAQEAVAISQYFFWSRLCELSAVTIIVYDYLLTFSDEVSYAWGRGWHFGNILFVIIRYHNFFAVIFDTIALFHGGLSDNFCSIWIFWEAAVALLTTVSSETVLILRIYAMYAKSKKILISLIFGLFLSILASILIFFLSHGSMSGGRIIPEALHEISSAGCIPFNQFAQFNTSEYFLFWIPILCFEAILCGLAIAKGVQNWRRMIAEKDSSSQFSLLDCLVSDSIFYFVIMFGTYLVNLLVWSIGDPRLSQIPVGFTVALATVLIQHLLLGVRRDLVIRRDLPEPTILTLFDGSGSATSTAVV